MSNSQTPRSVPPSPALARLAGESSPIYHLVATSPDGPRFWPEVLSATDCAQLFSSRWLGENERVALAEHVVRHTAPGSDHWPGLALVLTNEIRLARLNETEAVWAWLEAGFRAHTQGADKESLGDLRDPTVNTPLTGVSILAWEMRRPFSRSSVAEALREKWPDLQMEMRAAAMSRIYNYRMSMGGDGDLGLGTFTYDSPWDSRGETALPPHPDDDSPWLRAPEDRVLGQLGHEGSAMLCRGGEDTQRAIWTSAREWLASGDGPALSKPMYSLVNLPSVPDDVLESLVVELRDRTQARALKPVVALATAVISSGPTRALPRLSRLLLSVGEKFPSIDIPWLKLLHLLPLNADTRDLWWSIALVPLSRKGAWLVIGDIENVLRSKREAAGAKYPHLYRPSDEILTHYRGQAVDQLVGSLSAGGEDVRTETARPGQVGGRR